MLLEKSALLQDMRYTFYNEENNYSDMEDQDRVKRIQVRQRREYR